MWYLIIKLKISNGLVIKQDKKNTYLNNFFSKVKVLAQLKHPNIVSYQESFEGKGCPVYIIKHIQTHICCSSFMNENKNLTTEFLQKISLRPVWATADASYLINVNYLLQIRSFTLSYCEKR